MREEWVERQNPLAVSTASDCTKPVPSITAGNNGSQAFRHYSRAIVTTCPFGVCIERFPSLAEWMAQQKSKLYIYY